MTPEQRIALDAIVTDTAAALAILERAASRADGAGAHGVADAARAPLAAALTATRKADEELRKAATNG